MEAKPLVVLEQADDQHSFISGTGRVVDQYIVLSRVTVSDQSVELNGVVVSIAPSASLSCRDVDHLVEFAALGSVDHMIAHLDNDNGRVVVLGCADSDH